MSWLATTLILISAIFHAIWNLAAKRVSSTAGFIFHVALAETVLWAPINLWLVLQNPAASVLTWDVYAWGSVFMSAVLHAFYFFALLYGYRHAPLSVVYPIARGTGPLISAVAAIFVFGESLTLATVAGILLIVTGVLLLSWSASRSAIDAASMRRGISWGVATGCFIALYTVNDAYGIKKLAIQPIAFDYFGSVLRMFLLAPFINKGQREQTRSPQFRNAVFTVAAISPGAYILVLFAMQLAPLSHVAPARELSTMFGAFLGGKFLKEGQLMRRIFAAAVISSGAVLLSIQF